MQRGFSATAELLVTISVLDLHILATFLGQLEQNAKTLEKMLKQL